MDNRKYVRASQQARAREIDEAARALREFDTFARFSDQDLERLAQAAHRTSTSGPWPLIRQQTPSDSCYILLSGEVGVYNGHDRIAVVGPGEVIGESVLRGSLRNATVTTIGRAEVLHIARDDLNSLLADIPALRQLMDETVQRHVPGQAAADSN